VRIVSVVKEAADYLAARPEPLTSMGGQGAGSAAGGAGSPASPRRASLGTIPDYSFEGPGVKITGTTPGSAAEAAGLQAGDVLLSLDGKDIAGLREYAQLLAAREPGEKVVLKIRRGAETLSIPATLTAR